MLLVHNCMILALHHSSYTSSNMMPLLKYTNQCNYVLIIAYVLAARLWWLPEHCLTTVIWRCRIPFSQIKLRSPWLKFFWQRHVAVVKQGPGRPLGHVGRGGCQIECIQCLLWRHYNGWNKQSFFVSGCMKDESVIGVMFPNIPTLVQIMAWRRPLSEPMMVRLPTHIWVTQP